MLQPVVLRRTKHMRDVDGRAIVNLPSKRIENVSVHLSEAETAFYNVRTTPAPLRHGPRYSHRHHRHACATPVSARCPPQALYSRSKLQFDGIVATGNARTRMTAIWTLLLRLRQTCDHPFLVLGRPDKGSSESDRASVGNPGEAGSDDDEPMLVEEADKDGEDLTQVLNAKPAAGDADNGRGLDAASIRRLYVKS